MQKRCPWVNDNPLMIEYHDKEWGTPLKDDNKLFEFLVLDAFQAGLSWNTIIKKSWYLSFEIFGCSKFSSDKL